MATNEFLPFGTGAGANVVSQAVWAALATRANGFQNGVADPQPVNKALRQAAFVAAMIGQFTADYGGDALDNGDLPTFEAHFKAALAAWIASGSSPIDLSSYVLRAGDTMTGLFAAPAGFKTASRTLTTATTLAAADFGKFISLSSGSTFTATFPTPVSNGGVAFTVFNASGVAQTVSTPAGSFLGPGASSGSTESIPAGSVYRYESDGSNWIRSVASNAPNALPKLSFIQTTQTWTRAAGATKAFVIAHGPGGAGSADPIGTNTAGGSGGGSGGWAGSLLDISSTASVLVTISAGGTGVTDGNGGDGAGNTSFGSLVVAGPGGGGKKGGSFANAGGAAGVGITGQIIGYGNPGQPSMLSSPDAGANGGAGLFGGAGRGGADDGSGYAATAGVLGSGGGGPDAGEVSNAGAAGGAGWCLVWEF